MSIESKRFVRDGRGNQDANNSGKGWDELLAPLRIPAWIGGIGTTSRNNGGNLGLVFGTTISCKWYRVRKDKERESKEFQNVPIIVKANDERCSTDVMEYESK